MDGEYNAKWNELESIMLSEMNQRNAYTIWFHSYVEFKKQNKGKEQKKKRERNQETDS